MKKNIILLLLIASPLIAIPREFTLKQIQSAEHYVGTYRNRIASDVVFSGENELFLRDDNSAVLENKKSIWLPDGCGNDESPSGGYDLEISLFTGTWNVDSGTILLDLLEKESNTRTTIRLISIIVEDEEILVPDTSIHHFLSDDSTEWFTNLSISDVVDGITREEKESQELYQYKCRGFQKTKDKSGSRGH